MNNSLPKIAIIGRTNVGKSSLFNRIIQKRAAITSAQTQTTRDRIYEQAEWLTVPFIMIDTGGVSNEVINFQKEINNQVSIAISEADVIIFVCSYADGLTKEDEAIAKLLYQHQNQKPVILVLNKYDKKDNDEIIYEFYRLGFADLILTSANHGIGLGELLDKIISFLPKKQTQINPKTIKLAIIGCPNVGKSSLVNAVTNENRVIVSNIPGTTTDAIDTYFNYQKQQYCLIDTAGIRRKGKVIADLEKYSVLRSQTAIERSDIVLFVLDGTSAIRVQDLTVAGYAKNMDKPVIIVVNKWDLLDQSEAKMNEWKKMIKNKFKYLDYAFITFISALNRTRIGNLFKLINKVLTNMELRIQTSTLNAVINKAQLYNLPPNHNGGRLKIYYATQVNTAPPTFVLMVNNKDYCHFSYERFLINQIRETFAFTGVPIKLIFRNRKSLYHDKN